MLPYYYKFPQLSLSDDLKGRMVGYCLANIDSDETLLGGAAFKMYSDLAIHLFETEKELQRFEDECILKFTSRAAVVYNPHFFAIKHRDNHSFRTSVVYFPIYPNVEYAPINFYEKDDVTAMTGEFDHFASQDEPTVQIDGKESCYIFDATTCHEVKNNHHYRINLQFSFVEPLTTVIELIENKTLFKFLK